MNTFNQRLHQQAKARRARILRMREAGKSVQAIADRMKITRQRAHKLLEIARQEAKTGAAS